MLIGEVSKLMGVTVRTLQHYDKIGLLSPARSSENEYRLYGQADLVSLQQILFFRELGFSLNDIRAIMQDPDYDRTLALQQQKELLLRKRNRIDSLVSLLDNALEGEESMSINEYDILGAEDYAKEVRQIWGHTPAYAEYQDKISGKDVVEQSEAHSETAGLIREFADIRTSDPESPEAQALVRKWQNHISSTYYECSKEILSALGQMYVSDERFTKSLDANGHGTARFMSNAISHYTSG